VLKFSSVGAPAAAGAPTSNALTLRGLLDHVCFHGVERIRRICKPPRRKLLFQLPQEHIAFGIAANSTATPRSLSGVSVGVARNSLQLNPRNPGSVVHPNW